MAKKTKSSQLSFAEIGRRGKPKTAKVKRRKAPRERALVPAQTAGSNALFIYDQVRAQLAVCVRIDEVKKIADRAAALKEYARRAKDRKLIEDATRIREECEFKMGELLLAMQKAKGTKGQLAGKEAGTGKGQGKAKGRVSGGSTTAPPETTTPTYEQLGIDKKVAARSQRRAKAGRKAHEAQADQAAAKAVAAVDADAKKDLLAREAEQRRAEQAERRKHIEHGCTVQDLSALAETGKRFPVIYTDPPWLFKQRGKDGDKKNPEYEMLDVEAIKTLPIAPLAAKDCGLFMWVVSEQLPAGIELMKHWGFEFKTIAFVWGKQTKDGNGWAFGKGYLTRSGAEICLYGTRGAPKRLDKGVRQFLAAPLAGHSEKPEEFRNRIETLMAGPYLELFGRREVVNWTVWGNEIMASRFLPDDEDGTAEETNEEETHNGGCFEDLRAAAVG